MPLSAEATLNPPGEFSDNRRRAKGEIPLRFARSGEEMSPIQDAAVTDFEAGVARSAEIAMERIAAAKSAVGAVIFGQERVVEQTLATLLAGGHGLLIGVPGLAKTKLVETLGVVFGLDSLRVQFTPDLMPSDILGSEVMEEGADRTRAFRAIADGRRNQPREPAHAVGAAAGDAGTSRHGRGRSP
jgi:hypothetical protein